VFLFQVEDQAGKKHVVGAYSSHGWDRVQKSDQSCFLFNLTENLKFTSISRKYITEEGQQEAYSWIQNESKNVDESFQVRPSITQINFGPKELVMSNDLRTLSSDLSNSYFYTLYGATDLRDRVNSIVPGLNTLKPTMLEIWIFQEPPNIFFNNRNNESSDGIRREKKNEVEKDSFATDSSESD
jgi:hypothetical protein